MGPSSEESRAEHHVGLIGPQWFQETPELHGVVLEIGILDGDKVSGSLTKPGPKRRSLPLVLCMAEHSNLRMTCGKPFGDREAPVTGAVVHKDHFHGKSFILDL